MLQRCRAWIGCCLLGAVSVALAAEADTEKGVAAWLKQMERSVRTLSYEGAFVYLHNTQLEAMRITHTVGDGGEQERLFSLNGAAREVIRSKDSIICVLPDRKAVSVMKQGAGERGFPGVLPMNPSRLVEHYAFRMLGAARIADRQTVVIGVIPRDAYRYGYRLFLDAEHALPLKTDTINEEGEMVSQIMFTSLRVDPSIRPVAPPAREGSGYAWIHPEPAQDIPASAPADWRFEQLPDGFQLQVRTRQADAGDQREMEHYVFSDGLATLSVYIEPADDDEGLRGASRMGAINAYGVQRSGRQVTVVGEVPAQTVRTIAKAIQYAADAP